MAVQDKLAEKREKAIAYLGENYVLHPNYKPKERHSSNVAIWYPHRTLREVQTMAQLAKRI